MLKNHLLVAIRGLLRHRTHTALTVLGLALGMAVCLLILTFAWEQKNYDRFHTHADRIVRIISDRVSDDGTEVTALGATPAPLAEAVRADVPGIEASARVGQLRTTAIYAGKAVWLSGLYAEPSFFDLFDFETLHGDARATLAAPNRVLLTQDAATRIFGTEDPSGKAVTFEGQGEYLVGGIVAAAPGRSHLDFDALVSFSSLATSARSDDLTDWANSWTFATYFLLDRPGTAERLAAVLPGISEREYAGAEETLVFKVQPLKDIALGPVLANEISTFSVPAIAVYFLGVLGLLIMLTAGFNYVNLSVARAVRRAREVGTRKTLGANRWQVLLQFSSEAVVVALGSLGVAYGLLVVLLPAFNDLAFVQLMDAQIEARALFDPRLIGLFVAFSIGVGLIAGLYPALRLAFVPPMAALSASSGVRGFSGRRLRYGLIGLQFALALFFFTTTALLVTQARFLIDADYGFAQDGLLAVDLQGQDYDLLREELLRSSDIFDVSATSSLPASGSTSGVDLQRDGMAEPIRAYEYAADPSFLYTLGLDLVAGRAFSRAIASDSSGAVVLNETAIAKLGFDSAQDAVGATVDVGDDGQPMEIVGVVQDYHYHLLTEPIDALVLRQTPAAYRQALVRVRPGAMDAAAAHLETVWARVDPLHRVQAERFDHQLADSDLNRMFGAFSRLIGALAVLAMLITALGLFGMAAYHVETRTKEVGVRKVLGASRGALVLYLSRDFLWLVGIASVLTIPATWLAGELWLGVFATRIALSPWLFLGSAVALGSIALGIIASQTLRAASADPIQALRYE